MTYRNYWSSQLQEIGRDCSAFGSWPFIFVVCVAVTLFNTKTAGQLVLGLILEEIVGSLIKLLFFRDRPRKQHYENFAERIDAAGFPSLHSSRLAAIVVVAGTLGYPPMFIGAVLALMVGWSRTVLRKHRWIDVIAGYSLGAVSGAIAVYII